MSARRRHAAPVQSVSLLNRFVCRPATHDLRVDLANGLPNDYADDVVTVTILRLLHLCLRIGVVFHDYSCSTARAVSVNAQASVGAARQRHYCFWTSLGEHATIGESEILRRVIDPVRVARQAR